MGIRHFLKTLLAFGLATLPFAAVAENGFPVTEDGIFISDGSIVDYGSSEFGANVAIYGDWAAVVDQYAEVENPVALSAGAVWMYRRDGRNWVAVQKIRLGNDFQQRGDDISLYGNTLVIGVSNQSCSVMAAIELNCGEIRVYKLDGDQWVFDQTVVPTDREGNDRLGRQVDLNANTLITTKAGNKCVDGTSICPEIVVFQRDSENDDFDTVTTLPDAYQYSLNNGHQIAIYGDTLAYHTSSGVNPVAIYTHDWASWTLQQHIHVASQFDFGYSLSLYQDTLAIGSPQENCSSGASCGSVHIYQRTGNTWSLQTTIQEDERLAGTRFGSMVSLFDGLLVIGADRADCAAGEDCGYVKMVRGSGASWSAQNTLRVTAAQAGDRFGFDIAIDPLSATRVLLGAPSPNDAVRSKVYTATELAGEWDFEDSLYPAAVTTLTLNQVSFGISATVDGEHAVIAGTSGQSGSLIKKIGFYRKFDGYWEFQGAYVVPGGGDARISSLELSGDTLVVGVLEATRSAPMCTECGSALVFKWDGDEWSLMETLWDPNPQSPVEIASDLFGSSVATNGDYIAVGAHNDYCDPPYPNPGTGGCGKVVVYKRNREAWDYLQTLLPPDTTKAGGFFGQNVKMDGNTLAVAETVAGIVHLYSLPEIASTPLGPISLVNSLPAIDTLNPRGFGTDIQLSGDRIAIKHERVPGASQVFVSQRENNQWGAPIQITPAMANNDFGESLALLDNVLIVGAPSSCSATPECAGRAYIFENNNGNWTEQGELQKRAISYERSSFGTSSFAYNIVMDADSLFITSGVSVFYYPIKIESNGNSDSDDEICFPVGSAVICF